MTRRPYTVEQVEAAGGYDLIYADPALGYRNTARGSADKHYATMTLAEAKSLPVARLAARDSLLLMWTTWPYLVEGHQAHDLMEAWGFEPVTAAFVWAKTTATGKDHVGLGWWTRSNTEVCLLGVRGRARRADSKEGRSVRQLLLDGGPETLVHQVGRHSQKPAEFRRRAAALAGPDRSKLEMFARERTPGWDLHGDEAPGGPDVAF